MIAHPTRKEVAAVMCRVANGMLWKRGKRNFYVVTNDIFGIKLMVRRKSSVIAMTTTAWRAEFKLGMSAYDLAACGSAVIPGFNGRADNVPIQCVRYPVAANMEFEIYDEERFTRDWSLLRMFSHEWEEYAAAS